MTCACGSGITDGMGTTLPPLDCILWNTSGCVDPHVFVVSQTRSTVCDIVYVIICMGIITEHTRVGLTHRH